MSKQIRAAIDAEANAKKHAEAAALAQVNAPKIGGNAHWFVWDSDKGAYVDTGISANGAAKVIKEDGRLFNPAINFDRFNADIVGTVNADKKIVLTGALDKGETYTFVYVDEAGNQTFIATRTVE